MRKVLITGGAGSLGRELAMSLVRHSDRVRVFDLPACDFSPFRDMAGLEVCPGNLTVAEDVCRAVVDVDSVVHLAALLPPASERNRALTWAVNVEGTRSLITALKRANPTAYLILSSSVCVYGDTTGDAPPIRTTRRLEANDIYAESKTAAEQVMRDSDLPHAILRISGISVPAFLEPPAVWPFQADQRLEFVCRADVVEALRRCLQASGAVGQTLNIAGGLSWQMRGGEYVAQLCTILGMASEEAAYSERPGYFDWYDTEASQAILGYQQTSFEQYAALLERAVAEALGA